MAVWLQVKVCAEGLDLRPGLSVTHSINAVAVC